MGTKGAVLIMMVFALVRSFVRSPATEAWIHATQTVSQGDRSRRQETRGRERERERELNQHLCIEAHEEHLDCISPSCERETALARTPVSFPLDTKNWAKREQQRQTSRRERERRRDSDHEKIADAADGLERGSERAFISGLRASSLLSRAFLMRRHSNRVLTASLPRLRALSLSLSLSSLSLLSSMTADAASLLPLVSPLGRRAS